MEQFLSKIKLKESGVLLNLPSEITELKNLSTFSTNIADAGTKPTILFLSNKEEFDQWIPQISQAFSKDFIFWICYPKGGVKNNTNINRDILWHLLEPFKIRPVTIVALNEKWSALRFRPINVVKTTTSKKK